MKVHGQSWNPNTQQHLTVEVQAHLDFGSNAAPGWALSKVAVIERGKTAPKS